MPTASIDALVTDPPYSSGGMVRGDRTNTTASKYVGFTSADGRPNGGAYEEFTGDNRDQRGFHYWTALWLGEGLRLARPGALVMVFTDWRQLPTVTDAIQAGGWVYRGVVAWDKHNIARPRPIFRSSVEFCVWGSAGSVADYPPATTSSILACAPPRDREHMTQKPLDLMRSLVKVTRPGGTILDPFMGSGTTGVAALAEGRQFVGVELTDHYYAVAESRVRAALGQATGRDSQDVLDFGESVA
jgi:site-specific DNA-methyltransferase (adenine-specific)